MVCSLREILTSLAMESEVFSWGTGYNVVVKVGKTYFDSAQTPCLKKDLYENIYIYLEESYFIQFGDHHCLQHAKG